MEFEVIKPEQIFIRKWIIKEFINENGMWFSEKTTKLLNESVKNLILKAIDRAKLCGRKRVMPQDI